MSHAMGAAAMRCHKQIKRDHNPECKSSQITFVFYLSHLQYQVVAVYDRVEL